MECVLSHTRQWAIRSALVLVLHVLMALLAPNATPSIFAAPMVPVESLLNADGTLNTSKGISGTVDLRGWNVTLDSVRGPVLMPLVSVPAISSAIGWAALTNNGLNPSVVALAVSGSDLYVGGVFTQSADGLVTNLNHIAQYSNGAWSALAHNGLNGVVWALAVSGTDPYVGGEFTQSADGLVANLNFIAKYTSRLSIFLPLIRK